jgi:hypothetical protein
MRIPLFGPFARAPCMADSGAGDGQRGVQPAAQPSGRMVPDEEDGRGLLPGGAPAPASTASGASARAGGGAAAGEPRAEPDDDDEPHEAPQSPLSVWMSLLLRLLFSLASTAVTAVLFVLYPVYCLIPRFVLETLFKGLFRIGYLIYLTPVGASRRPRWRLGLHAARARSHAAPPRALPAPGAAQQPDACARALTGVRPRVRRRVAAWARRQAQHAAALGVHASVRAHHRHGDRYPYP